MRYIIFSISATGLWLSYVVYGSDPMEGYLSSEVLHESLCIVLCLLCLTGLAVSCEGLPKRLKGNRGQGK